MIVLRRCFKLSHHDYYFKLSMQVKKLRAMTDPQEIVKYSENAIKVAKPKLDLSILSPEIIKLSKILDYDLILNASDTRKYRVDLINHSSFSKYFYSTVREDLQQMSDAERAISCLTFNIKCPLPLNHDAIESFEQMNWILQWKKSDFLSKSDLEWLKSEADRLMDLGKVDLFQISFIYKELSKNCLIYEDLFNYFNDIINNYAFALSPEDLLRVLRANWLISHKSLNLSKLQNTFALFNTDQFSEYSIIQFAAFFLYTYSCKLTLKKEIIEKAESILIKFKDPFQVYIYYEFSEAHITADLIKKFATGWSSKDKVTMLKVLLDKNCNDSIVNEMLNMVGDGFSKEELIYCASLLNSKKRFPKVAFELVMRIKEKVDKLNVIQMAEVLQVLIELNGFWKDVSLEMVEALGKSFLNKVGSVDFKKFDTFVQSFSEVFPYQPAHLYLCKVIIDNEKPDRLEPLKKLNKYYLNKAENFLIYENSILSEMTIMQVIKTFKSIISVYEIDDNLITIIKKYTEVILRKYFITIDIKLRLMVIEIICDKRIFEPYLADLFIDKAIMLNKLNQNFIQVHNFDNCLKKLVDLGYNHPTLNTFLGKISNL